MKSLFKSKTAIVNAIIALSTFYPPVGEWVQAHPEGTLQILSGVNFLLRIVTKKKVTLFGA